MPVAMTPDDFADLPHPVDSPADYRGQPGLTSTIEVVFERILRTQGRWEVLSWAKYHEMVGDAQDLALMERTLPDPVEIAKVCFRVYGAYFPRDVPEYAPEPLEEPDKPLEILPPEEPLVVPPVVPPEEIPPLERPLFPPVRPRVPPVAPPEEVPARVVPPERIAVPPELVPERIAPPVEEVPPRRVRPVVPPVEPPVVPPEVPEEVPEEVVPEVEEPEIVPEEEVEPEEAPVVAPGEPIAVELDLDYGEIRSIAYGAVDRLLVGLRAGDVKVDLVTEPVEDLTGAQMIDMYINQGDLLEQAVRRYMRDRVEIPAGDSEAPERTL